MAIIRTNKSQDQQQPQNTQQQVPPVENVAPERVFTEDTGPLPGKEPTPNAYTPHSVLGTTSVPQGLSGMAAIQAMFNSPITADPGSALLNKFIGHFREIYDEKVKERSTQIDLRFVPLPAETLQLPYSGIAVCNISNRGVSIHILVLEDDGPKPDPQRFSNNQETIEIPTTPADTYNESYWDTAKTQVLRTVGLPQGTTVVNGGMQVIYRTVDPDDLLAVGRVLTSAANAAVGAVTLDADGANNAEGRTLHSILTSYGVKLSANVNTHPEPMYTANGLPVRRDISIKSYASIPNQTQNNLRGTRGSGFRFSELSAFLTLEYVAPPPMPMVYPGQPIPPAPTQRYIPRVVMTSVESDGITTLPNILLGISTATVLQEGILWTEPFRPQKGNRGDIDTRDIGAIGYDIPEIREDGKPAIIDTKSNAFGNKEFYQLIQATVFPTPIYSIDIEEAGPLSWLTNVFRAAAANNPEANRAIIEACDSLTNNLFSKYFQGDMIIRADENRVFLGTYTPVYATGDVKADLRDLDYLAVLNVAGSDPRVIEAYEETQRPNSGTLVNRLAHLYALYEEIIGNFEVKGYAQRFTFYNHFIEALSRSTREAGIAPSFQNLPQAFQQNVRRQYQEWEWAMTNAANLGQIHQTGGSAADNWGNPLMPHQWAWNQYRR